jgi:hypothetical protein
MDIFVRQLSLNAECFPHLGGQELFNKSFKLKLLSKHDFQLLGKKEYFKRRIPNEHF